MTAPIADGHLAAAVSEIAARHPVVGLAVGLVVDGRLAAFVGHGVADRDTGVPIDRETVFRIASITKTVTGIAIMQLWENGRFDLDAPLNAYLQGYSAGAAGAFGQPTVRHLLTHTGAG